MRLVSSIFPRKYLPGDWIVYHKPKFSPHPGPRATHINPTPRGENYTYYVDKYWVVVECREDGAVVVQTRGGKTHVVDADDPKLRHANLWERLRHGSRFPRSAESP